MNTLSHHDRLLALDCVDACERAYGEFTFQCPRTSTQVLIVPAPRHDAVIVAFRASREIQDFIRDAKIHQVDWSREEGEGDPEVHNGFSEAFFSVMPELKHVCHDQRIIFTGHSLGASEATLAALYAKQAGWSCELSSVVTFGSPRVGNRAFCNLYDSYLDDVTMRFVAQGDPVPRVPWLFGNYRHVQAEFYLSNDGITDDPGLGEVAQGLFTVGRFLAQKKLGLALNVFAPHHITNYRRLISNLP